MPFRLFSNNANQFYENELSFNQNIDDLSIQKFREHFTQQQAINADMLKTDRKTRQTTFSVIYAHLPTNSSIEICLQYYISIFDAQLTKML